MTPRSFFDLRWPLRFAGPNNLKVKPGHFDLPLFQAAVTEFHMATGWPLDLGYFGALGAISAALQSQVDMVTPKGRRPVSLYMLGIGVTSGGKSTAAEYFLKTIETFEASRDDLLRGRSFIYSKGSPAGLYKLMNESPRVP